MRKTIISDTSCLILLENKGELQILKKLFGIITTTPEVANEFGHPSKSSLRLIKNTNQLSKHLLIKVKPVL